MKRICLCVTNDLRYDQRMGRICQSLSDLGYDITLVGRKINSRSQPDSRSYAQVLLNSHFSKGKMMYLEFNLRLFFFLLKRKPDAITAIDLDTILPVYLVSVIRKIPLSPWQESAVRVRDLH